MASRGTINRLKSTTKRKVAMVLTAAMVLGLTPSFSDIGTARADSESSSLSPSVWAYASKARLQDDTFAPQYSEDDGSFTGTYGLLQFGKNSDGDAQRWFLLGADDGVNEGKDNVAIFAMSDIMAKAIFYNGTISDSEDDFQGLASGDFDSYSQPMVTYVSDDVTPKTIGDRITFNHYGASYVRKFLKDIEKDTNYFRSNEQSLLSQNAVQTVDPYYPKAHNLPYNSDGYYIYTTKDKLYLAGAQAIQATDIYIGTQDVDRIWYSKTKKSIKLSKDIYWGDTISGTKNCFWLRTAYPKANYPLQTYKGNLALMTSEYPNRHWTEVAGVSGTVAVRPAANINLKNVLFASAAEAASDIYGTAALISKDPNAGAVANGDAMTLRLDGSILDIGSVELSEDGQTINITKGGVKSDVALVVQGQDSTAGNWYYSKEIMSSGSVPLDDIASALESKSVSTLDLTKCAIWLETSMDSESSVTYAVQPAHMHDFSVKNTTEANLASAATCTSPAKYYYVCSTCGAQSTDTFDYGNELGHHYAVDDDGNKVYTPGTDQHWYQCDRTPCSDLDGSIAAEGGKIDHTFDQKVRDEKYLVKIEYNPDDTDPDKCIKTTTYYYSCVCGASAEVKDKTKIFICPEEVEGGHAYGEEYIKKPIGHFKICANCGYVGEDGAHEYDDEGKCITCGYLNRHTHYPLTTIEAKEATCTEDGCVKHYKCEQCDILYKDQTGLVETTEAEVTIPAHHTFTDDTHHDYKAATCTDEGNREYYECSECGKFYADKDGSAELSADAVKIDKIPHTLTEYVKGQAATCTESGSKAYYICDSCKGKFDAEDLTKELDDSDIVIQPTNHKMEHFDAVPATCNKEGNVEYWYCSNCGKYFSDDAGKNELTSITVSKKAHTPGSTYLSDETNHWKTCTVCGTALEETAHIFNGNTCTVCGYTKPSDNSNSTNGGTTYSDGSTKNSDRSSGSSSGGSSSGGSSSGGGSGSSSGVSAVSTLGSTTGGYTGWTNDASGRWWYYNAGAKVVGWAYDTANGKWYYCDETNGMLTGWFHDASSGYWYYLDAASGEMLTGWQLINGKQYYFALVPPASTYSYDFANAKWVYSNESGYRPYGSMYAGTTTPDNYSVGTDGAKIQ